MNRSLGIPIQLLTGALLWAATSAAAPVAQPHEFTSTPAPDPLVDDLSPWPSAAKIMSDTTWIADWTFDASIATCTDAGWVKYDPRPFDDGSNYWTIAAPFGSNAAVLAKHDLCWARDGYGNGWDYSIVCQYRGASTLSFNYAMGSEPGFDFVTVETDSAGASESRAADSGDPQVTPDQFRTLVLALDGVQTGTAGPIALEDFRVPGTIHEVYIRFASDDAYSDEDGLCPSAWNAGVIVDNISVTGGLSYNETFDGTINIHVALRNTARAQFGLWARVFSHVTDNDKCGENTTCSWLFTDPDSWSIDPMTWYGPGGTVVRNGIDNAIVSPWVSLATAPGAMSTVLSYRLFGGQTFSTSGILLGWSVRSGVRVDNTDTSTPGDSITCPGPWEHANQWGQLGHFSWTTIWGDMTPFVTQPSEIQLRFRDIDWYSYTGSQPPGTLHPGPGPYIDRVRIGRWILTEPVLSIGIDTRSQAQDCFPTAQNAIAPGEHFSPTTDVFGTCAFSRSGNLQGPTVNLITGDSITVTATDVRGVGGINAVRWYGAITGGPHGGKAPAPWSVGANGFFEVTPEPVRNASGQIVAGAWFVDLDDTYFRGGDELVYFWTALDAGGGRGSTPGGITAANFPPVSVAEAELLTGGLYEVSFLPTMIWAPQYLARIAADPHGDLDPTPGEIAASSPKNCIFYINQFQPNRRSGEANRTSFTYTLDRLGYRGYYDVYDVQGYGNTNNQLAGRATVEQCAGYSLLIADTGRGAYPNLPDGSDSDSQLLDQAQWYRDYLAQASTSPPGIAALWLVGEDLAFEKQTNALIATDFGLASVVNNQSLDINPNVTGQGSFTFTNGNVAPFAGDVFALNGGCPVIRDYDGAGAAGTAVVTYKYTVGTTTGTGAVIMNKNVALGWNTIWMGFGWDDIRLPQGASPYSGYSTPDVRLANRILNGVLWPIACARTPTDVPDPQSEGAPSISALHPNVPNPFNPATAIRFDLARDGRVTLRIFDVTGKIVATLIDGQMTHGFGKSVTWNGLDSRGRRVPSGVYLYRLETGDFLATRKMVVLK